MLAGDFGKGGGGLYADRNLRRTFNPIHLAHVHLVRAFIEQLSLNRVLLILNGAAAAKAAAALACNADRLAMCRLAAAEISNARWRFRISRCGARQELHGRYAYSASRAVPAG